MRRVTCLLAVVAAFGLLVQGTVAHAGNSPDARHVVVRLKALGLPIASMKVYTPANDPNHLLGRPGQYTSKVNFRDRRLAASSSFDLLSGGSVEVFATNADAQRRYKYVHAVTQSASIFVEYDYLDGRVFLRLSQKLTPAQAKQYAAALKRV